MREFFDLDSGFERTIPQGMWRVDLLWGVALSFIGWLGWLVFAGFTAPGLRWQEHAWAVVALALAIAMLIARRRYPVMVLLLLTGAHFVIFGSTMPMLTTQGGLQVIYFLGLYSAIAWAKDRRALRAAVVMVLLTMTVWLVVLFAIGDFSQVASPLRRGIMTIFTVGLNIIYFGAALWLGHLSWVQAKDHAELKASRDLIDQQATQLSQQAILSERIRIARELHDSIAHQASLIGLQAGAARRATSKRPEQATEMLQDVERTSRQLIQELRHIVGSLRDAGEADAALPDLEAIPAMLHDFAELGLTVNYDVIGDTSRLSPLQNATIMRLVQESLTNVRRHSGAHTARVTVRVEDAHAEAEILDAGPTIPHQQGTGVGQIGMRERVAALGGSIEMGPRNQEAGYRVLARFPLVAREAA